MQNYQKSEERKTELKDLTIEQYEEKIRYLTMQLDECREELAMKNSVEHIRNIGEKQLTDSAADRDRTLKDQSNIARLRSELASQKSINLRLKSDINMIHNSISWKLTAPIRAFGDFIAKKK